MKRGNIMEFKYNLPSLKKLKKHPLRKRSDVIKSGVYALFYKEELVYVGQSFDVYRRLYEHAIKYKSFEMKPLLIMTCE